MRDRLLQRLARLAIDHPGRTLVVAALCVAAFIPSAAQIGVRAGHSGMMDPDLEYRQRWDAFLQRYGSPDQTIIMVEGGDERRRRALVDALVTDLPAPGGGPNATTAPCDPEGPARQPGCVADVFGRVDLGRLTPRSLLYLDADDLRGAVDQLIGEGLNLARLRGIDGLAGLFDAGREELERRGEDAEPDEAGRAEARRVMGRVAAFLRALATRVRDPATATPLEQVVVEASARGGLDAEGYLSSRDGAVKLAFVRLARATDDPLVVGPAVGYVRAVARARAAMIGADCLEAGACAEGPLRVAVTGMPAVVADEMRIVAHDVVLTGLAATVGLLLVLLLGMGSVRRTLLGLVPLVGTLIVTIGFTQLAYQTLNLITAIVVPTMVGLSIDAAVHLLQRYQESREAGRSDHEAIEDAIVFAGPGLVTGALTTSGAFLALMLTDFRGFREMGVIVSVGLVAGLALTLTVVPALLSHPRTAWMRGSIRSRAERTRPGLFARVLTPIPSFVVRHPAGFLSVAAVSAGLMLWQAGEIPWSYDYVAMLPEEAESTQAMVRLSDTTEYSAQAAAVEAPTLEATAALAARLEALPTVERVEALIDYVPPDQEARLEIVRELTPTIRAAPPLAPRVGFDREAFDEALTELVDALDDLKFEAKRGASPMADILDVPLEAARELAAAVEETPDAAVAERLGAAATEVLDGRDRLVRVIDEHADAEPVTAAWLLERLPVPLAERLASPEGYAIYIYPSEPIWDGAFLGRLIAELRSIDPEVTGFPVTHWETIGSIRDGFYLASILAILAVAVLLLVDFRRITSVLLTLVPLAIAVGWTWGLMSLLGFSYDAGNTCALPLILGIAVDSGVHIVHRFDQQRRADVAPVVLHTGRAVLISGLTTMAGFGSMVLATHTAMAGLGVILLIGIGSGLVAATLVLPALLELVRRRQPTGASSS